MTAPTTSAQAQAYLGAVAAALADLSDAERAELLEDLELHLAAVQAEHDERPLEVRLGAPDAYAAELRSAAGLPPRSGARRRVPARLASVVAVVRASRPVRELVGFGPQLLPAWWVLRGYLLVLLPSLTSGTSASDFPVPAPWGSHALGVVLVALAVVLSVALGRRRLPRLVLPLVVALDLAVLAGAVSLLGSAPDRLAVHRTRVVALHAEFSDSPLITARGPVTDIYPYTLDGRPLTDVLLYDQDGRPLRTGRQLWWADHCRRVLAQPQAVGGIPVPEVYPKHYVLDPAAVTLSGMPIAPGQCKALSRPAIVVPTLAPTPARTAGAR